MRVQIRPLRSRLPAFLH